MIDIKTLHIGSHVEYDGKPVRICGITKRKIGYHESGKPCERLRYARLSEIEPIPITPELLEKIGFYDYRPIKWPIKYPYWCTGENSGSFILIAYVDNMDELYELWPEAEQIEWAEENEIFFSDRFPKPDWYKPKDDNK